MRWPCLRPRQADGTPAEGAVVSIEAAFTWPGAVLQRIRQQAEGLID